MIHTFTLLTALMLVSFTTLSAAEAPFAYGIEHGLVESNASDRHWFFHDPAIEFHQG